MAAVQISDVRDSQASPTVRCWKCVH